MPQGTRSLITRARACAASLAIVPLVPVVVTLARAVPRGGSVATGWFAFQYPTVGAVPGGALSAQPPIAMLGRPWTAAVGAVASRELELHLAAPIGLTGGIGSAGSVAAGTVGLVVIGGTVLRRVGRVPLLNRGRPGRGSTSSRSARLLAALGISSLAGWLLQVGSPSEPLLYFGGIGLFGAVLVSLLLPERTVPPVVAEGVHEALVATADRVHHPGDPDATVYVVNSEAPTPDDVTVWQRGEGPQPSEMIDQQAGSPTGGSPDGCRPSGARLYDAFLSEPCPDVASSLETFAWQLCRGLTDWFELAEEATPGETGPGLVSIEVRNSTLAGGSRFEHPVSSFLGVAVACHQGRSVIVDVEEQGGARDYRINLRPIDPRPPDDDTGQTPE